MGELVLGLLMSGDFLGFGIVLVAIILSLSLHEYGHALSATLLGDPTPRLAGRLTLNPGSHIDLLGLAMVVLIGFGYAKPVPFNPRFIRQGWGPAAVAAAGPLMNLLLAIIAVNLLVGGLRSGSLTTDSAAGLALMLMAQINLLLMLFNLIPLGPLDGHYIMSWLLPPRLGMRYDDINARYGTHVFLLLVVLSVAGVPVFRIVTGFSQQLLPYLTFM